jgi:hypothetical protein
MTTTPNIGLSKPAAGASAWNADMDGNSDILDALFDGTTGNHDHSGVDGHGPNLPQSSVTGLVSALAGKQASDADLTTIAGLTATTDNFMQAKSSAWASRTPTQVTADLIAVVGDSGSGGTKGLVPAPGAGDAAAGKFLKADGTFAVPAGSGMSNPMTTQDDIIVGGAAGAPARLAKGTDGQVLTVDPTTHHLIWATPTGGGGAPTTVPYVTTASDGTLSAEVVIPGLAGSPDLAGAAGAGFAEEYDSGSSGLTWSTAPTTEDVNTTAKSHLYLKATTALSDALGYKSWSPAGDFDIRAKLEVGHDTADAGRSFGLVVMNSANTVRLMLQFTSGSGGQVQAYTYSGSYSLVGSALAYGAFGDVYLRIVRISGTVYYFASRTGLAWTLVASTAFSITVARRGFRLESQGATTHYYVDWWRSDVA